MFMKKIFFLTALICVLISAWGVSSAKLTDLNPKSWWSDCSTHARYIKYKEGGFLYKGIYRNQSKCLRSFCKFCTASPPDMEGGLQDCLNECDDMLPRASYARIVQRAVGGKPTEENMSQYIKTAQANRLQEEQLRGVAKERKRAAGGAALGALNRVDSLLSELKDRVKQRNAAYESYNLIMRKSSQHCGFYRDYVRRVEEIDARISSIDRQNASDVRQLRNYGEETANISVGQYGNVSKVIEDAENTSGRNFKKYQPLTVDELQVEKAGS